MHPTNDLQQRIEELEAEIARMRDRERALEEGMRSCGLDAAEGNILGRLDEIIFRTDVLGRLTFVNPAWRRITGHPPEQCITSPWWEWAHPDHRTDLRAYHEEVLLDDHRGPATPMQFRMVRGDGETRWMEASCNLLPDADGEPRGTVGILRDVTEQRAVADSLRSRITAIEQAGESIVITDRQGNIEYCNPAFSEVTGYHFTEVIGRRPSVLKSGLYDDGFYRDLWATILGGRTWKGEIVNRRKDGTLYYEEMTIAPVREHNGEITRFVAIKRDVTDRKRAETELRTLTLAVEQSPNAVMITDAEGVIEYCNPRFYELSGYSPGEVVGRTPGFLSTEHTPRKVYRELWAALQAGEVWYGEFLNRRKDGSHFRVLESISPIADEFGRIVRFVAVGRDISEHADAWAGTEEGEGIDEPTGLPGRTVLANRLEHALEEARRVQRSVLLLHVHLDGFRPIANGPAPAAGEQVLRPVAKRLHHCVRQSDLVCRIGETDFAVLLPMAGAKTEGATVAAKIIQSLTAPVQVEHHLYRAQLCIGIGHASGGALPAEELRRQAEAAMHIARKRGNGQFQHYSEAGLAIIDTG